MSPRTSEFARIAAFTSAFPQRPSPFGPGDDCAIIPAHRGPTCVTTDSLVEGVHFTRATFSPVDIGHKALAVNLSDLAAMGAKPDWALCSLMLPRDVDVRFLKALGRGMAALAKTHAVSLVGGNITGGPVLAVTLTLSGTRDARFLTRSGAKSGDTVYVSGPLGDAAAGLVQLQSGHRAGALVRAQRRPNPHVALGRFLASRATACIDVSDGLLQDLGHIADASGVHVALDSSAIPLSRALSAAFPRPRALEFALSGGEDYVLAFTGPSSLAKENRSILKIGKIKPGHGLSLDEKRVSPRGFQHR